MRPTNTRGIIILEPMKPELIVSLGALLVSVLNSLRIVRLDRRQRATALADRKLRLSEEIVSCEGLASILYCNVLTLELTCYREEVRDVIVSIRSALPECIEDIRQVKGWIDGVARVRDGDLIEVSLRVATLKERLRTIESQLTIGLERGQA